ncbi:ABC transporter ATP-binding protein [Halomicroarcula sp. F27]|uniref:ABC transporter ATP-binding protein n=1 Tax=Haloarcula nitratireducens TaxID=2487749 RepID=A0AAW4P826_9EURY|nr:ABC transporter ATP-binding protein [Halomicroarcula nitratireducens]MBX0293913.1 ABC transporter ATP-binding protein [Halomicroarcula nitratireducens]
MSDGDQLPLERGNGEHPGQTTAETTVVGCDGAGRVYRRSNSRFGGESEAHTVTALDDVTLQITPGEFVGIAGPSGSGKSTLLHLLAGLDAPTSGTVSLAATDVGSLTKRERTRLRLDHVGIVFQRFHLLPALSAQANVALPLIERGVPKATRRERSRALLDRVGLGERTTHKPGALSGGEQQRVAVARALATEPSLLVADEPTGELDTATGERILDQFESLAADGDRAVVLASHDERALDRTDRVIRLRDGEVVDA